MIDLFDLLQALYDEILTPQAFHIAAALGASLALWRNLEADYCLALTRHTVSPLLLAAALDLCRKSPDRTAD